MTPARLGLQYVEDFKQRIPRSEAEQLIQLVSDAAEKAYGPKQAADLGGPRLVEGMEVWWENHRNIRGTYWTWDNSL